ncbi:hypothetical protein [Roseospira navarrensis]|uniref:Uncharacterized protein n=1 Tax=Roseospira navarrensis TaxID=140058 RepID=A0A7X2D3A8_9PROT|nr:hypothetical protein [Roseospira navarrensis]MQX35377.1 hypothetical protein [Roseospira navarrensis]
MTPVDQYRQFGLREPIRIRPGCMFHLMLWGGHAFLLTGSLLALEEGGDFEAFIGLFGLLFFGTTFVIMLVALLRGARRGTVEISRDGIFMSHIGVVLPWSDIGPAWSHPVRVRGMALTDVCFVVRNARDHMTRMDGIGRFLFTISMKLSHSRKGGAMQWGLHGLLALMDAGTGMQRQMGEALERMRAAVLEDPGAMVFNVPIALRFELKADDLVALMNAEVVARNPDRMPTG